MSNQIHILIVDDDPEIRSLLARYLGGSMDGVKTVDAINHVNETGAER